MFFEFYGQGSLDIGGLPPLTPEGDTSTPILFDFNGDGIKDIFMWNGSFPPNGPVDQAPWIFLSDGTDNWVSGESLIDGPFPSINGGRYWEFQDFNGDGQLDIFIASHGYDADPFPGHRNTLLLSNENGRLFDASNRLPDLSGFTHGLGAGDIDNDGDLDLTHRQPRDTRRAAVFAYQ